MTRDAVQSIDTRGIAFTKSMLQNTQEITTLINSAGSHASENITRTIADLETSAKGAIERSQKAATTAVSEMMETHGMLRNDTSSLFERLRDANVLLQEVLGGATENLSKIETLPTAEAAQLIRQ